jgi:hypothetical protein
MLRIRTKIRIVAANGEVIKTVSPKRKKILSGEKIRTIKPARIKSEQSSPDKCGGL